MAITKQGLMMRRGWITLMLLTVAVCSSSAEDYAVNITVTTDTSSATLSWTAADNTTADRYIIVLLLDSTTNLVNYTISDVNTETYTIPDLTYSTYYTVDLHTMDSSGQTLGISSVSFWTAYLTINGKFIAALAILGFILCTVMLMMFLKAKCLPNDDAQDEEPVLDEEKAEEPVEEDLEAKKTKTDLKKNEDILIF